MPTAIEELAADRLVGEFERRFGPALLHIAFHASLPVALTPEFVHFLRINFLFEETAQLGATPEADLLLSPLCEEISDGLYQMIPDVRNRLLEWLLRKYGEERLREVASLLWQYNERFSPWQDNDNLERAQQLTALNFLDPERAQEWLNTAEEQGWSAQQVDKRWFIAMRQETSAKRDLVQRAAQLDKDYLTHKQQAQLSDILVRNFPTARDLELIVSPALEEAQEVLSVGSDDHSGRVLALISWANRRGRIGDIIRAALTHRPEDLQLAALAVEIGVVNATDVAGQFRERAEKAIRARDYSRAQELLLQALSTLHAFFAGANEPTSMAEIEKAACLAALGGVYNALQQRDQAIGSIKEAVGIATTQLGAEHPKTQEYVGFLHSLDRQAIEASEPAGNFSEDFRIALEYAREEALHRGLSYVDTEHLLLGILRDSRGAAARVLLDLGVRLEDVRRGVDAFQSRRKYTPSNSAGLTSNALAAIDFAITEALSVGDQDAVVDIQHLLRGLLRVRSGVASNVLRRLGVSLQKMRATAVGLQSSRETSEKNRTDSYLRKLLESGLIRPGQILDGVVTKLQPGGVLIDIGQESGVLVHAGEMQSLSFEELQAIRVGSALAASVVVDNDHIALSVDAARQQLWSNLYSKYKEGQTVEAVVTGYDKDRLLVKVDGIKGFVPWPELSSLSGEEATRQSEIESLQNKVISVKIIDIAMRRNLLVLSERQVAQEKDLNRDIGNLLNLSMRSYYTLRRSGIETIAQLLPLTDRDLLSLRNFNTRSLSEVRAALAANGYAGYRRIEDLNLSIRTYNSLRRAGIGTISQLLRFTDSELLRLRNFGYKSLDELYDSLAALGYKRERSIELLNLDAEITETLKQANVMTIEQLLSMSDDQLLQISGLSRRSVADLRAAMSAFASQQADRTGSSHEGTDNLPDAVESSSESPESRAVSEGAQQQLDGVIADSSETPNRRSPSEGWQGYYGGTFAQVLRNRRTELGLSRDKLAGLASISLSSLSKLELGIRRPSRSMAELLAVVLDFTGEQREVFMALATASVPVQVSASRMQESESTRTAAQELPRPLGEYNGLTLGQVIRQRRKELGLARVQLADMVGISQSTLASLEFGRRRPSRLLAEVLADALGFSGEERDDFVAFARATPPILPKSADRPDAEPVSAVAQASKAIVGEVSDDTSRPVEILTLSNKTLQTLKRANLDTLRKVLALSSDDLLRVLNSDAASFQELREAFATLGYTLPVEDVSEEDIEVGGRLPPSVPNASPEPIEAAGRSLVELLDEAFDTLSLGEVSASSAATRVPRGERTSRTTSISAGEHQGVKAHQFGLTARELEVLKLITQGFSNAQIADALAIHVITVKSHVSNILHKLGVRDRYAAKVIALQTNILR